MDNEYSLDINAREVQLLKDFFSEYFKITEDPIILHTEEDNIDFSFLLAKIGIEGIILPDGTVS